MDEITMGDKLKFLVKHTFGRVRKAWNGSYTKAILDDKLEESKMHCKTLNSILLSQDSFGKTHRVLISYEGEKNFCTVLSAESYVEIDETVKHILQNYDTYPRKQFGDFSNMIDKIHLITHCGKEIEIFDTMNLFIQYTEPIIIRDVVYLHEKTLTDIKSMKIVYYKDMELLEATFDFHKIKNEHIDTINKLLQS